MAKDKITNIEAIEILDSRGNPTIKTTVTLEDGNRGQAAVPSGASTGIHEALELRDNDTNRYSGKGVLRACENVNEKIKTVLNGIAASEQEKIDKLMIDLDGTENKSEIGANSILSVSLATAVAASQSKGLPLYKYLAGLYGFPQEYKMPIPMFNIFNGGLHADTNLDFQEFMIIPLGIAEGEAEINKKIQAGAEIFHELGKTLRDVGYDTDVGNEGGYAPDISSSVQAIEMSITAIKGAGYTPGEEIGIGIDVGSSTLYNIDKKQYIFKLDNATFTNSSLVGLYNDWFRKYPVALIEDGLAEDDWEGWKELAKELSDEVILVGDDLFTTNIERLQKGIDSKVANAILIKPNQVGTLSETIATIKLAHAHSYTVIVSHRSGETCDSFIADLAVASGADMIKSGSLSRSERLAKYNRLLEIENELKS